MTASIIQRIELEMDLIVVPNRRVFEDMLFYSVF